MGWTKRECPFGAWFLAHAGAGPCCCWDPLSSTWPSPGAWGQPLWGGGPEFLAEKPWSRSGAWRWGEVWVWHPNVCGPEPVAKGNTKKGEGEIAVGCFPSAICASLLSPSARRSSIHPHGPAGYPMGQQHPAGSSLEGFSGFQPSVYSEDGVCLRPFL